MGTPGNEGTGSSQARASRRRLVLCGALYGLFTVLAFAPIGWWPCTLLAAGALAWGALGPMRAWGAAWIALGALPAWAYELRFLTEVTIVGYPMLALAETFLTGTVVWFAWRMRRFAWLPRWLACAAALVAVEVLRGEVLGTGFAWFLMAHPLIEWPVLATPAGAFGTYFVSFLACAASGALVWWMMERKIARGAARVVIIAAVWAGTGYWGRMDVPAPDGSLRVAVVQTNVAQSNKLRWKYTRRMADLRSFLELSEQAARGAAKPDVILWPETMFPGFALNRTGRSSIDRERLQWNSAETGGPPVSVNAPVGVFLEAQKAIGVPMLVGAPSIESVSVQERGKDVEVVFAGHGNSVFLVHDGEVEEGRYDKMSLTPFGEVIPYVWRLPELQRVVLGVGAGGMMFDLVPGKRPFTFEIARQGGAGVRVVTPICFELTKGSYCRELVRDRWAGLMVNPSNDGWFTGFRGGREQHEQIARWRCVELGVPMVRAVNTGISSWIDERGVQRGTRLEGAASDDNRWTAGVLRAEVPVSSRSGARTPYAGVVGEWFSWLCLGFVGILFTGSYFVKREADKGGSAKAGA